jgi:ribulose-5-phosphate 4-epimerase/fuculose-1-phosphate aldolase
MSPSKAVIMAHHGALCFGKDSDEAFDVANMLEKDRKSRRVGKEC